MSTRLKSSKCHVNNNITDWSRHVGYHVLIMLDHNSFLCSFLLSLFRISCLMEWVPMGKCCEQALAILPEAEEGLVIDHAEGRLLLLEVVVTEAILAGYWEGVLEETRWELGEQRRAAATTAVPRVGGQEGAAATKKSKAAKRKQQKRKAQQKKRAAELTAGTTARGGAEVSEGQDMNESQQEEQGEKQDEEGDEEGGQKEDGSEQGVTAAAIALGATAVGGKKGGEE